MKRFIGGVAIALTLGCAAQMPAVRVMGDPAAIAALAGRWGGEYWGAGGGRRGSLSFELRAGTDTLYGDVMMVDQMGNVIRPADPADVHRLHVRSPQQLRIEFVAALRDSVRGVLEPYISPDCECAVSTAFVGQRREDRIAGTFETRSASMGVIARGFWEVTRGPATVTSRR